MPRAQRGLAPGLLACVLGNCEKVGLVHVLCFYGASWQENMSPYLTVHWSSRTYRQILITKEYVISFLVGKLDIKK